MSDSKRCKLYESLSCESSAHSFLNELHCSDIGRSAAQELCRIVCREAKTEWEAANTTEATVWHYLVFSTKRRDVQLEFSVTPLLRKTQDVKASLHFYVFWN